MLGKALVVVAVSRRSWRAVVMIVGRVVVVVKGVVVMAVVVMAVRRVVGSIGNK